MYIWWVYWYTVKLSRRRFGTQMRMSRGEFVEEKQLLSMLQVWLVSPEWGKGREGERREERGRREEGGGGARAGGAAGGGGRWGR